MRKAFEIGGIVTAAVLIAFGVVAIVMGVNGRNTVNNSLSHEYIVAGADMTPSAIKAEAQKAGIASAVSSVADDGHRQPDDRHRRRGAGDGAVHAHPRARGDGWLHLRPDGHLHGEARDAEVPAGVGRRYQQREFAAIDPTTKQPVQNGARQVWISETALTNALNMSYHGNASSACSGSWSGSHSSSAGLGFGILAVGGALRNPETAVKFVRRPELEKTPAVPVA